MVKRVLVTICETNITHMAGLEKNEAYEINVVKVFPSLKRKTVVLVAKKPTVFVPSEVILEK